MNRGQVLAVDFEKRELKGTQQNSDNDKQSFYRNKTKICNDAVTIFQTAKSGGIWHMRAYVGDADKYYQKSLRTRDKASAIDKATLEHAKLLVLKSEGKAIFSPTVYKAVEQYLQHRYDMDTRCVMSSADYLLAIAVTIEYLFSISPATFSTSGRNLADPAACSSMTMTCCTSPIPHLQIQHNLIPVLKKAFASEM